LILAYYKVPGLLAKRRWRIAPLPSARNSTRRAAWADVRASEPRRLEALARTALAQADESEHYVAFQKPLEVVTFLAWQEGRAVEIDIDDAQVAT
jgi:hypothetical protein